MSSPISFCHLMRAQQRCSADCDGSDGGVDAWRHLIRDESAPIDARRILGFRMAGSCLAAAWSVGLGKQVSVKRSGGSQGMASHPGMTGSPVVAAASADHEHELAAHVAVLADAVRLKPGEQRRLMSPPFIMHRGHHRRDRRRHDLLPQPRAPGLAGGPVAGQPWVGRQAPQRGHHARKLMAALHPDRAGPAKWAAVRRSASASDSCDSPRTTLARLLRPPTLLWSSRPRTRSMSRQSRCSSAVSACLPSARRSW